MALWWSGPWTHWVLSRFLTAVKQLPHLLLLLSLHLLSRSLGPLSRLVNSLSTLCWWCARYIELTFRYSYSCISSMQRYLFAAYSCGFKIFDVISSEGDLRLFHPHSPPLLLLFRIPRRVHSTTSSSLSQRSTQGSYHSFWVSHAQVQFTVLQQYNHTTAVCVGTVHN